MATRPSSLAKPRLLAAFLCALTAAACSNEEPGPAPSSERPASAPETSPSPTAPEPTAVEQTPPAEAAAPEPHVYTVRGEIVSLPEAGNPRADLRIKHEAIDNYRRGDKVVGMNAMTMPFPVAEGVSLEGLAVGDKVEFVFEVQMPQYQITRITKLPADTVLEFRKANPPAN